MECDFQFSGKTALLGVISTHALTWSATTEIQSSNIIDYNFNSRTHVECDKPVKENDHAMDDFNSRTHVECDGRHPILLEPKKISTHALTWSATTCGLICARLALHFNSRTHVECDPRKKDCRLCVEYFNSRTHVECDAIVAPQPGRKRIISTHALTWSATQDGAKNNLPCCISTHALTWSATFQFWTQVPGRFISTHALTWSATISLPSIFQTLFHFNSRTHVECDIKRLESWKKCHDFNSRTHVECDVPIATVPIATVAISTHALTWSATG